MEFQLDYENGFFDIHECGFEAYSHVKEDFCNGLEQLLTDIGSDPYVNTSISKTVFHAMVHEKVHYHTPVHVLSLLSFAESRQIELTNAEKLAIFFHDAIYRPNLKSPDNENNSIKFMYSILSGTGIAASILADAQGIIECTANHLSDHDFGEAKLVMDLDVSGFAAKIKTFRVQNECIEKEYYDNEKMNYGFDLHTMLTGRLKFLETLKTRKTIYRTQWFLENCEKVAQSNLKNLITDTKRRLKVIQEKTNANIR